MSEPPVILMDGNPLLREPSKPVVAFDETLFETMGQMIKALVHRGGRGLAAIQIGVPLRIIVVIVERQELWMINPVIVRTLNRNTIEREGCLSVEPRNWRRVSRPAKCEIEWQDSNEDVHRDNFRGEWARVLQHEIDHLDGVLISDLAPA